MHSSRSDKPKTSETHVQMIGEGQQSVPEFSRFGGALLRDRLLDGGDHRDRLAVISEDSGLTPGGGSSELGEMGLAYPNTDRLHLYLPTGIPWSMNRLAVRCDHISPRPRRLPPVCDHINEKPPRV